MTDLLFTIGAAAVMYAAFGLLSLSQERHRVSIPHGLGVRHPSAAAIRRRRLGGALGLAAGLMLCLSGHGSAFGSILWTLLLGACALAVALTLAWKPDWLHTLLKLSGN